MSERRYIRIQPGKEEDCSTGEAAAAIRDLLTKVHKIASLIIAYRVKPSLS